MKISLVWFRRNLRIADNRVLARAAADSDIVIPVYVWDIDRPMRESPNRAAFLIESVGSLTKQFSNVGQQLVARRGHVIDELIMLVRETNASAVYCDNNYEPYEIKRDTLAEDALRELGVALIRVKDNVLFESHEVRTKEGKPYTVFTPFKKAVWDRVSAEAVECECVNIPTPPTQYESVETVKPSGESPKRMHHGGSEMAQTRWQAFTTNGLATYRQQRDILSNEIGTSGLSPHVKFGTISISQLVREALELADDPAFREGAETFVSELLWREFYYGILTAFPQVEHSAFQKKYNGIRWLQNDEHLDAWKTGRTGVPIVDAAMRQLLETGWMHNRARMIVASFLTKDLLINWQEGEEHFMWWLTDGDLAQNNGGWQWSASTGTDAQPYYRIFNPYLQSKRFDPDGEYIRRYIPELRGLPTKYIHEPQLMTPLEQAQYGCVLGEEYPYPIVDHSVQREKAKAMFQALRENLHDTQ